MISLASVLKGNTFVWHNAIFFIGSFIVAVLNYLYHPIVGRLLTVEQFGEVQVLFSIFTQAIIPMSIFSLIALNLYTNDHKQGDPALTQTTLLMAYVAGATALVLICVSPFLTNWLSLSSPLGIVLVAITILISGLSIFGRASLQAAHRFALVSVAAAISAGGKLILAVILIMLGFDILGAIGSLLLASLLAYLFIYKYAPAASTLPKFARLRLTPELKNELKFALIILFGTGFISFMTMADIIFAKLLFDPTTAGEYSGISVVGRIIFFGTASIAGVLLTHIKYTATVEANQRILKTGLLIVGVLGGVGLAICSLFPGFVVNLLLGSAYSAQSHLLPLLATTVFTVSLVNVCVSYSIALRSNSIIWISCVGILSTTLAVFLLPAGPEGLIQSFLCGSVITLLLSLYATLGPKRTIV